MKGLFITFEGIEGAGKSTQAARLMMYLQERRFPAILTREPGGTKIGNQIRAILSDPANSEIDPLAEVFLFAAARAQHVNQVIAPSLEEGFIVVCDRFADATMAYQGYGRGVDFALIREINSAATWGVQPDLTFILDIEPAKALLRLSLRFTQTQQIPDRIEREKIKFFEKVRGGYLRMASEEAGRFHVLEGTLDPATLAQKIQEITMREVRRCGITTQLALP